MNLEKMIQDYEDSIHNIGEQIKAKKIDGPILVLKAVALAMMLDMIAAQAAIDGGASLARTAIERCRAATDRARENSGVDFA